MDMIDRAIIKVLIKFKDQYLSTFQIATKAGIAPLTAKRHLEKLQEEGYTESKLSGGVRKYEIKDG